MRCWADVGLDQLVVSVGPAPLDETAESLRLLCSGSASAPTGTFASACSVGMVVRGDHVGERHRRRRVGGIEQADVAFVQERDPPAVR
jgi:hypothetical protein